MIQNNLTPIVIAMAAVIALAAAFIVFLYWKIRRMESEYDLLSQGAQGKNFVEIVNDNIAQTQGLLEEVKELSDRYGHVLRRMAGAVQHVGVVRYDAFRDLGGLLSFSVACLDDRGNGLIMSSIYGRTESRTYAKPIVELSSNYELSPEEREAIRLAMQSKEMGALPMEAMDHEHQERIATLKLFHDKEFIETARQKREASPEETEPRRAEAQERPQPRPPRRPPSREAQRREPPSRTSRQKEGREAKLRSANRNEELFPERAPERTKERRGDRPAERPRESAPTSREAERAPGRPDNRPPGRVVNDRVPPRRSSPKPRGLDTPVERLRNREPRGE